MVPRQPFPAVRFYGYAGYAPPSRPLRLCFAGRVFSLALFMILKTIRFLAWRSMIAIEVLLNETRALFCLVDDLQTLSLVETGQLPLEQGQVAIAELLQDVQTSFSGQAEAAGIELHLEINGDPNTFIVTGDAGRLDQVLSNLIANALRFTHTGGTITIRSEVVNNNVRITVMDTGVASHLKTWNISLTVSGKVTAPAPTLAAQAAAWDWLSPASWSKSKEAGSVSRVRSEMGRSSR